jgi:ankyrin repeat protein
VKYLLSHGANINLAGGRHGCALQASVCQGKDEIPEFLLEHGANVNAEGGKYGTALIAAAEKGRWAIMKLLLEKGADVNRTSKEYGTAMHQCLKKLINQLYFPIYFEKGNVTILVGERSIKMKSAATESIDWSTVEQIRIF